MNKTICDAGYDELLPEVLRKDERLNALAKAIDNQLVKLANNARKTIIFANLDEQSEEVLDILAYDLHVDWYDYNYNINTKRDIIKNCIKVHRTLGTKYALETALGALHPASFMEEWFEYDGEPFHFRIVLDVTNSREPIDYPEVSKTIDTFKRKTAVLEDVIFQCTMTMQATEELEHYLYKNKACGSDGVDIEINTVGAEILTSMGTNEGLDIFEYQNELCGTDPYINVVGADITTDMGTSENIDVFEYQNELCGTDPYINTVGGNLDIEETNNKNLTAYSYTIDYCGEDNII